MTTLRTTVRVPVEDDVKFVHEPATRVVPPGMIGGHCPLETAVTRIEGLDVFVQLLTVTPATAPRGHWPGSSEVYIRVPAEAAVQLAKPPVTAVQSPFSVRTTVRVGDVTLVHAPKVTPAGGAAAGH